MASTAALYTPQVLALATGLAALPLTDDLPLRGSARSPACGSTLELGFGLDQAGRIGRVGVKAHACAIGQAAAAIFAGGCAGQEREGIAATLGALEAWLAGQGGQPDWPGLDAIAAAQGFPGRHGAMLLPWKAALEALPTT
ncbi:iron-sulfur cluster assembly scaffold protein [Novosphingobium sp.]|uniref:iron-sulfur cluster assembly scaffold protein n=1 Tax=Novosphingobium sp. TaxID=1874826 RepID=UPI0035B30928